MPKLTGYAANGGSDFLSKTERDKVAAINEKLAVKAYHMPLNVWEKLTELQKQDYLQRHGLAHQGYTLTGPSSVPSNVEFCDAALAVGLSL